MLDVCAGKGCYLSRPVVWRQIEIVGAHEVADTAALMGILNAGPETIEFLVELIGFVEKNRSTRNEVDNSAVGTGDGRVKLPAGKNVDSARTDGGFHDFFIADNALAAEASVNCAEKMFADRRFSEWEQQSLVYGTGRTLRSGIELANRIGFVAEEFDAEWPVGLRRVDIEDAAAHRILAGHFNDVGRGVADCVEMREQRLEVEGLAAADGA